MKPIPQKVYFHELQKTAFLKERRKLKSFIESLFKIEKIPLHELHFVFCSDSYMLKINNNYLHHNFYTDIITFDLSDDIGSVGEVYISVDRLKENAKEFSVSYSNELLRLIFHGSLHLCGYRDKTGKEKKKMKEKEDFFLNKYTCVPRNTVSQ